MYKKGVGNDKQGKDAGNRTLCPYRNFSQAIIAGMAHLHCIAEIHAYWVETKLFQIDNPRHHYQIA